MRPAALQQALGGGIPTGLNAPRGDQFRDPDQGCRTADGAYDHRSVYDRASAAGTENVVIVIPPRRSALSAGPTDGPWAQREASLQRIRKVGRREWQKEPGYRQQARVENSFFRYKSVFGGALKARHSKAQRREAAIGCHILNRMAELGRPSSYALGR